MKKTFLLLISVFSSALLIAQGFEKQKSAGPDTRTPLEYGRMVVDTLTQPYFRGRGYTKEGDVRAGYFVASELYKFGLQRFKSAPTFYQNYNMSVNVFQDDVFLAIGNRFLTCGIDFVPGADSRGARGTYEIVWLDSATLSTEKSFQEFSHRDFKNVFVVMDDKGIQAEEKKKLFQQLKGNPFGAKGLIFLKDKITWTVSQDTAKYVTIDIVRGKISRNESELRIQFTPIYEPNFLNRNVIAYVPGKEVPDTFIIVSAHFDHLGQIGRTVYFPGANDNASGTAMMLSLARHFAKKENQPKYSICFIGFSGEEAGLVGSKKYVFSPVVPLEKTKFVLNMDIMGTGDEGITVVNATEFTREFDILNSINTEKNLVSTIKKRGPAANSDHYFFYEKGVPCFFVYTMGGIKAYHDLYDRAETLPLTKFGELHQLFVEFIGKL